MNRSNKVMKVVNIFLGFILIFSIFVNIEGYSTYASSAWKGYAVYRDGVVEYVYEWYGYRVGGPDGKWDITRNLVDNYWEHSGFFITPRKQNQGLLTFVSSSEPY